MDTSQNIKEIRENKRKEYLEKIDDAMREIYNIIHLEPYIIVATRGRKYRLGKLIDHIEAKLEPSTKFYQPDEIRVFLDGTEFMEYLKSYLIKKILIKLYCQHRINKLVLWFATKIDLYNHLVKK